MRPGHVSSTPGPGSQAAGVRREKVIARLEQLWKRLKRGLDGAGGDLSEWERGGRPESCGGFAHILSLNLPGGLVR